MLRKYIFPLRRKKQGRGDFGRPKIKYMAQPPNFDIDGSIYFITTSLGQEAPSFNEREVSKTLQLIKDRASRKINKGSFWQKRFFDFAILTDKKFQEKFNYIHYNLVKKGLVEKAEDYKYSSALEYRIKYGEVFYE